MDVQSAHLLVLETLKRAVSQDLSTLKEAEVKLKEWEKEPGFYVVLMNIFCNYEIEQNVRLSALLYCKNGVDRYWRRSCPNALSEEEKDNVRRGLLQVLREPIDHLAVLHAVLIAKVSRFDCPVEWPQLVPTLLEAVQSEDPLVRHRSVLVLHHVVKTLASKRLAADKRVFHELASNIFSYIHSLWQNHTHLAFLKVEAGELVEGEKCLQNALLSLRIIDKLIIYGFKKPHEVDQVNQFLNCIFSRAKDSLQLRRSLLRRMDSECGLIKVLEKYIYRLTSILLSLLDSHPFSFVDYVRPCLELAVYYAFTPEGETHVFDRFLMQCFNLIKGILRCPEYKPTYVVQMETRFAETDKALQMKKEFFTDETLKAICRRIVTHYFLLTPTDLDTWAYSPESFAVDEGGESWKYSLRPCVENLFVCVVHEFRSILAPLLVELIQSCHAVVPPSDYDAILAKDAVYNAIGLAAFDMYDEVNFDDWFLSTLREELKVPDDNYRVLRRRIAWLLGQWTGVKLSWQLYPEVYRAMVPLLGPSEDMVVRLTAASTLKTMVDDFEFNPDLFYDFLEPFFQNLFHLLKTVSECDTKMKVLNVLSFVVERMGVAIRPHFSSLFQYLPLLWLESESHNMLRCAVVSALAHLVKAVGRVAVSEEVSSFILTIVSFSTDVNNESHVYLLEDGLELWWAVVTSYSKADEKLMSLFNNMPPLLENNTENLVACLRIIHAYILLCPDQFLSVYGERVMRSCAALVEHIKPEEVILVMRMMELCLKANPDLALPLLTPLLPAIVQHVYRGEEYQMMMTHYLSILSRVLLYSTPAFNEAIGKVGAGLGKQAEEVMSRVLEVWLDKMPLIVPLDKKKLLALALSSLLSPPSKLVYDKFCGILLAVTEVLNDITRFGMSGEIIDSLVYTGDADSVGGCDSDVETFGTEHEQRRKQLALADPVHCITLDKFLNSQLSELQTSLGADKFHQFVDTVDSETLQMARQYVPI